MKARVLNLDLDFSKPNTVILMVEVSRKVLEDLPPKDGRRPLQVEITVERKRRSLSANAYCWVLCEKIAEKVGLLSSTEVYRKAIQAVGQWLAVSVPREQVWELKRSWERNGEGWIAVQIDGGYGSRAEFRCYKGSSVYDTKEMSRLIDWLVEEAKNLDIDTVTPEEKARLLSAWEQEA